MAKKNIDSAKIAMMRGQSGFEARDKDLSLKLKQVKSLLVSEKGLVTKAARVLDWEPNQLRQFISEQQMSGLIVECRQVLTDMMLDHAEGNLLAALENNEKWATIYVLDHLGEERGYMQPGAKAEKIVNIFAQEMVSVIMEEIDDPILVDKIVKQLADKVG